MKKILLFAISAMLVMAGCGKNDTDDNPDKPNKPDSENPEKPDKPDDPDSGKLPELPDPTDVCSGMDDIEFMKYCYEHFDVNKDGKISEQEYNAVKEIDCDNLAISSFKGIEYFTNLETFSCKENTKIKTIDLSHNKKITSIVEKAFYNCKSLTSIAIPDSVAEIGDDAFYGCTGLTGITLPYSVTKIGNSTFSCCTTLTSVAIPDSVTEIGGYAFSGCTGLTSITIPNSVAEIGDYAFYRCTGKLYVNCDIPNGRHQLSVPYYSGPFLSSVFAEIIIGDSVQSIGDYAFRGCNGLTSVTIGKGVVEIGRSAFYGCTGLTSVTIPDSVTEIGDDAFYGCTGLKAFYGKYASEDNRCVIFDGVLKSFAPAELTTYVIPYSVAEIGESALEDCTSLTRVTIPDSVIKIGGYAFSGCKGLTSITIPNSVTEIGNSAFRGCESLTRVTIPDSVIKIGGYAFSGCTGMLYVNCNIPDGKFNGRNSFVADVDNCSVPFAKSKFMNVIIGNNVKYIGTNAFYDCENITSITIGNSVTSIGRYAFYGCKRLISITIPDSVTEIGEIAFYGCTSLTSFYGKFSTEDRRCIVVNGSLNSFAPNGLTEYIISNNIISIGGYAFYGCSGLTKITIPDSVKKLAIAHSPVALI